MKQDEKKYITKNKKATFDYFVLSTYEAGIVLFGTEIKSIRQGSVNLKDSYCEFKDGELFVRGMHISPYEKGNIFNRDPLRLKKLLLHKREIMTLFGKTKQDGLTLIPLSLYFSGSKVKMELGLCRGKKNYDKRETIAKKEANREMEIRLKARNQ
ncbi:MAG: SsrA-binding protein SmpB [Clostridia bacterium]|nr:SsrA-binding protein SmpB [Clostridia bacterium]